jgi:hypothetical protein
MILIAEFIRLGTQEALAYLGIGAAIWGVVLAGFSALWLCFNSAE